MYLIDILNLMIKTKSLFSVAVATMIGLGAQASDVTWQTSVDEMIANGEFTKAEQFMKKLPRAERKAQAVRIDSLNTIMTRIRKDFTLTPEEGVKKIRERIPDVKDEQIRAWIDNRKIETMVIDGKECWFRKAVGNLWLLADEFATAHAEDKESSFNYYRGHYLAAMKSTPDDNGVRNWQKVQLSWPR